MFLLLSEIAAILGCTWICVRIYIINIKNYLLLFPL